MFKDRKLTPTGQYSRQFVKTLGWYQSKNTLHIAMEYLSNGDLHDYMEDRPALPEQDACQVVGQVLAGLESMHTQGYAHRDVKPKVSKAIHFLPVKLV